MFRSVARPACGALALLLLTCLPANASAAEPAIHAAIQGRSVTLQTDGTVRTGAWRIRIIDSSDTHRLVVTLKRGDVAPVAFVKFMARRTDGWHVVRRIWLVDALTGGAPVSACYRALHACFDSRRLTPPADGTQNLRVTITLKAAGTYGVSGGTRRSIEAFILEPWHDSAPLWLKVA